MLQELDNRGRLRFFDIIAGKSRHSVVASFVAVLELLKSQRISVQQTRPFEDIWIESRAEVTDENQPLLQNSTDNKTSVELETLPQD